MVKIVFLVFWVIFTAPLGYCIEINFENAIAPLIQKAELVVEVNIIEAGQAQKRSIPTYVGEARDSIFTKVGEAYLANCRVNKIYKGTLEEENLILYVPIWMETAKSGIVREGRYVFFLKKHPVRGEYVLIDPMYASWRIFDYNGKTKVKKSSQILLLRESDDYTDYSVFEDYLLNRLVTLQ